MDCLATTSKGGLVEVKIEILLTKTSFDNICRLILSELLKIVLIKILTSSTQFIESKFSFDEPSVLSCLELL
jgi:hypothetical protein